jgi:hypothetical protein
MDKCSKTFFFIGENWLKNDYLFFFQKPSTEEFELKSFKNADLKQSQDKRQMYVQKEIQTYFRCEKVFSDRN